MLALLLPLVLASTILATPLARQNTRQYTMYNKCPTPINLYIGGTKDGTIPTDGNLTRTLGTYAGYIYTDANGGNETAERTIRAAFYDDYYYIISDPNHTNTGLQVKPKDRTPASANGFCETIQCDQPGCEQAFSQPPASFPAPVSNLPSPPYYRCPVANTDYDIIFCPTGRFPDQGQPIHFDNFQNKCLGVRGGVFTNGTPVYDCNGTQAQLWMINRGSTKVQVARTNFCLDAGTNPENGVELKIWQCYDGLPAQQWSFTADNRIALENQAFCMDLENGIMTSTYNVQAWTCSDNNTNQVWTL